MLRIIAATVIAISLAAPAWADFDEAVAAHERGDYMTALREWRPLAEQGNVAAQTMLGAMYYHGQGVSQDYGEAIKWSRRAAEQGVPQDYVQAHMWASLAAARKAQAERELAITNRGFVEGQMMPAEIAEAQRLAREWMEQHEAAQAGHDERLPLDLSD